MPEGRCDLILLAWTAFVGFNLISDFLWSGASQRGGDVGADSALAGASPELYRGNYRLNLKNGSTIERGNLRMVLVSQPTGAVSVHMTKLSLVLLRPAGRRGLASRQADLHLTGIELSDAGKVTASGAADLPHLSQFSGRPCRLSAAVQLGGGSSSEAWARGGGKGAPASLAGEVVAGECGFSVAFTASAVDIPHLTRKVYHYSIWANVLTMIQIRCYLMQMRYTDEGPSAAKVSVVCVAMQALMDAYDSFLHLCLGFASEYMFNTIAVVTLFKFILFSLLEARYMLMIWRRRRHEAFNQGWGAVRRELSWLYSRFYGVLVIGLIIIYNNREHLDTIVLIFQAYWVPQILHDAWQGSKSAVSPYFFVTISVTRTLPLLYLWGCPRTIFSGDLYPHLPGSPSALFCALVVSLQVAQVTVMALQNRLGPRWFVPWVCMPWAYNYHRGIRIEPGTDCVICMSEIDPEDAHRVTTPCSHSFHRVCLEQWMDVKMECPTCRMTLPPIQ